MFSNNQRIYDNKPIIIMHFPTAIFTIDTHTHSWMLDLIHSLCLCHSIVLLHCIKDRHVVKVTSCRFDNKLKKKKPKQLDGNSARSILLSLDRGEMRVVGWARCWFLYGGLLISSTPHKQSLARVSSIFTAIHHHHPHHHHNYYHHH